MLELQITLDVTHKSLPPQHMVAPQTRVSGITALCVCAQMR